jgi:phosphoglycolate phosphatase
MSGAADAVFGAGRPFRAAGRTYRLLVFDWDGTVVDSIAGIVEAIQRACVDLGEPEPTAEQARYVIGLGMPDAIVHFAPGLARERYRELSLRYRDHYLRLDPAIGPFPGMRELLAELGARGFLLGVATGKSRRGLARAMEASGLAHHFAATRCADEGPPKPDPGMLTYLMDRLGVAPGETLMIGDTTHDMELATNAGVDAVAVGYGAHDADALRAHGPVAAPPTVAALRDWLLALGLPAR